MRTRRSRVEGGVEAVFSDLAFILLVFLLPNLGGAAVRALSPDLELPDAEATAGEAEDAPEAVLLEILADGSYLLDGEPVGGSELKNALNRLELEAEIWVATDRNTAYGALHPVLRELENAGRPARMVERKEE